MLGVAQLVSHTKRPSQDLIAVLHSLPSFQSRAVGIGHPVESLSDVQYAEARSA
ncbi:hypothetical protein M5G07_00505 [Serratia symbiotica]|nr:hypothetical protein [Serratia symbiotica]